MLAILSAFTAAKGLFGGITLRGLSIAAAVAAALVIGFLAVQFVSHARADASALARVTVERDSVIAAANASEARHAAAAQSAAEAATAARDRSANLESTLEAIRHAPSVGCTPSAPEQRALDSLRGLRDR